MDQKTNFKFPKDRLIYSGAQGIAFVVMNTPDEHQFDGVSCYKLKRNNPPHWEETYSQNYVETSFTDTPPHPIQQNVHAYEDTAKFKIRDVVYTVCTERYSIIVDKPMVEYEGKMIPGYKFVPAFNPGGYEEFTLPQVTAEVLMSVVDNPEKYIPSLEDFAPYLIRGDILNGRLFPELKKQLYVLKVECRNANFYIYGRMITKGVASDEIVSFTKRELANNFTLVSLQTPSTPVTEIKYGLGDTIKHIKSGEQYDIVMLPNKGVLENTREPAYSFQMPDGRVCHRAQAEVEDPERFVLVAGSNNLF